jgi:hypothetical protein
LALLNARYFVFPFSGGQTPFSGGQNETRHFFYIIGVLFVENNSEHHHNIST